MADLWKEMNLPKWRGYRSRQIMHEHRWCSDSATGKASLVSATRMAARYRLCLPPQPNLSDSDAPDSQSSGSAQFPKLAHDACSLALSLLLSEEAKINSFWIHEGL
jgi:hypothetical protein